MKKAILFLSLILIVAACHDEVSTNDMKYYGPTAPKMVPDHTPYIIGLIQYSPDTTFHYPEVVVGYFTDTRVYGADLSNGIHPQLHYKGLYSIMLTTQLTRTSLSFDLSWQPESHAVVKVSGPLGTPQEKQVTFTSEGNGVYGDVNYALPRIADGKYKLRVKLPDGRVYGSKTYIPDSVSIQFPDSISTKVTYGGIYNFNYYEGSLIAAMPILIGHREMGFSRLYNIIQTVTGSCWL